MDHIRERLPLTLHLKRGKVEATKDLPSYSGAKRILDTLQLPYQLGKNTLENSNICRTSSFFLALVDQMSDPEIRLTISQRAYQLIKTPDDEKKMAKELRKAIVEYCKDEFINNSEWIEMYRHKFLDVMYTMNSHLIESETSEDGKSEIFTCGSHNCKQKFDEVDSFANHVVHCCSLDIETNWDTLLDDMRYSYTPATEVFIRAAALFFEKDILIIEDGKTYRIHGSLDGVSENPPMAMVHMGITKFQSALRLTKPGTSSDARQVTADVELSQIDKCRGCNTKVQQINKHLAKKPECKKFYSEEELMSDSKEKRRASKKRYYEANKAGMKGKNAAGNVDAAFICHLCDEKPFSSKEHLTRHVNTLHIKFDKYTCSICKSQFPREDTLARHINDIHKAEKSFKCPKCPLTFARRDTFNLHVSRANDHPEIHGVSVHCKHCGEDRIFSSLAGYNSQCQKGRLCDCQSEKNK